MTGETPIRILVAEDHELARSGLLACLARVEGFQVAGEASNGREALRLAADTPVDLVVMDIRMPVMDGIAATQALKSAHPDIKVVMLTSHREGEEVYAALAAGADAYCMKDIRTERLAEVIRMVSDGAVWLDPAIAKMVMNTLPMAWSSGKRSPASSSRVRYNAELTDREKEVLEKLVEGKSNRAIADDLCITLHTVKAHVCNILQKLAVDDRTLAAIKAVRDGLV